MTMSHTQITHEGVKPPSVYSNVPDKIRNNFNHVAEMLTVVRFGSQILHSVHVIDLDAPWDVWPAAGFTVHYNDVLQPWHIAQNCLGWKV